MTGEQLMADLRKVPWWGWAGGGGAVLGAGYYLYKRHQGASAAPSSTSANNQTPGQQVSGSPIPAGLNMADLAGLPFDYQDYDAEYAGDTSGNPGDTTATPPPAGPFPQQGISLPATIGAPISDLANGTMFNVPPAAPFPQHPIPPSGTPPAPPPAAPLPQQQSGIPAAGPFPQAGAATAEYVFEFHNAG